MRGRWKRRRNPRIRHVRPYQSSSWGHTSRNQNKLLGKVEDIHGSTLQRADQLGQGLKQFGADLDRPRSESTIGKSNLARVIEKYNPSETMSSTDTAPPTQS